jgi:hypothetical protein
LGRDRKILSAVLPDWYGAPQVAFQNAVENGPATPGFMVETHLLIMHIIIGAIIAVIAGYVAALISGESKRTPLIAGILLLALGLAKVAMAWPYVPIWSHIIFTLMLLPLAIAGGKLRRTTPQSV